MMTFEEYYKAFVKYFKAECKDYTDVFEESRKIQKALNDAEHHVASDMYYGED